MRVDPARRTNGRLFFNTAGIRSSPRAKGPVAIISSFDGVRARRRRLELESRREESRNAALDPPPLESYLGGIERVLLKVIALWPVFKKGLVVLQKGKRHV